MQGGRCSSLIASFFKILVTLHSRSSVSQYFWFGKGIMISDLVLKIRVLLNRSRKDFLILCIWIKSIFIRLFIFSHKNIMTTWRDFYGLELTILNLTVDLICVTVTTLAFWQECKCCCLVICLFWKSSSSTEIKESFLQIASLVRTPGLQ